MLSFSRRFSVRFFRCWLLLACMSWQPGGWVHGQNLVPNPGFGDHGLVTCMGCHSDGANFRWLTRNWDDLNTNPFLHDCKYKPNQDELSKHWGHFNTIPYKGGCSMMEMHYSSNCMDFDHRTKGCTAYLATSALFVLDFVFKFTFLSHAVNSSCH